MLCIERASDGVSVYTSKDIANLDLIAHHCWTPRDDLRYQCQFIVILISSPCDNDAKICIVLIHVWLVLF